MKWYEKGKPEIDYMSESLKEKLYGYGLNKSQVESITANTMAKIFFGEDSINAIDEVKNRCAEIISEGKKTVEAIRSTYNEYQERIDKIGDLILEVKSAAEEYGEIKDQKFKDAISMYATLLAIQKKAGVSDPDGASYIVYAALGGQAARNIMTNSDKAVAEKPGPGRSSLGRI